MIGLGAASGVEAARIYVPNASFESQATAYADPRIDLWQKAAQPVTFDTNVFGAWDNLSGVFANPSTGSPPDPLRKFGAACLSFGITN